MSGVSLQMMDYWNETHGWGKAFFSTNGKLPNFFLECTENRAVSGVAESRILDGRDHGGQEQGHVYFVMYLLTNHSNIS